jgi:hypothetical protein
MFESNKEDDQWLSELDTPINLLSTQTQAVSEETMRNVTNERRVSELHEADETSRRPLRMKSRHLEKVSPKPIQSIQQPLQMTLGTTVMTRPMPIPELRVKEILSAPQKQTDLLTLSEKKGQSSTVSTTLTPKPKLEWK